MAVPSLPAACEAWWCPEGLAGGQVSRHIAQLTTAVFTAAFEAE